MSSVTPFKSLASPIGKICPCADFAVDSSWSCTFSTLTNRKLLDFKVTSSYIATQLTMDRNLLPAKFGLRCSYICYFSGDFHGWNLVISIGIHAIRIHMRVNDLSTQVSRPFLVVKFCRSCKLVNFEIRQFCKSLLRTVCWRSIKYLVHFFFPLLSLFLDKIISQLWTSVWGSLSGWHWYGTTIPVPVVTAWKSVAQRMVCFLDMSAMSRIKLASLLGSHASGTCQMRSGAVSVTQKEPAAIHTEHCAHYCVDGVP